MKRIAACRRSLPLWSLLLAAVLLRALVPVGYMLGGEGTAGTIITICHGAGIAPSRVPASPEAPPGDGHAAAPCLFAMSAATAPPPATPRVPAAPLALFAVVAGAEVAIDLPSIVRAQSSRGPPAPFPA